MKKYDLTPQETNTMSGIDGLLKLVGIDRHKMIAYLEKADSDELGKQIWANHKVLEEKREEFRS